MINKKTLSEQIYDSIKQDIMDRKIDFGEKLVNREYQEKFGVSSTPVRDAINRLYQDGLVEDITKSGAKVIQFDLKSALEINEIIAYLNINAIKMSAAHSGTEIVSAHLQECINKQAENKENDTYYDYDYMFHNTFFEFTNNSRYQQLFSQYFTLWKILVMFYYYDKNSVKSHALLQHERILSAYKTGNVQLAQYIMEQHFTDAAKPLTNALRKKEKEKANLPMLLLVSREKAE